jgi:hypothetical protein
MLGNKFDGCLTRFTRARLREYRLKKRHSVVCSLLLLKATEDRREPSSLHCCGFPFCRNKLVKMEEQQIAAAANADNAVVFTFPFHK